MDAAFMELRNTIESTKHHIETMNDRVFHMQIQAHQTGSEFNQGVPQPAEEPRVHRPQSSGSPTQPNVHANQHEKQAAPREAPLFQIPRITSTAAVLQPPIEPQGQAPQQPQQPQ